MSKEAFIVGGCRTAIGKFKGALSSFRTDDLAAVPISDIIKKYNLPVDSIDEVILGCANQAGEDNRNIARMALLLAGLHYSVPGETVNRLCASGMSSVIHAQRAILCDDAQLVIAGGVEHMTRAPWVMSKSAMPFGNDVELFDSSFGWRFINNKMDALYGTDAMGVTAENLADKYDISRELQDRFAAASQQKANAAQISGRLGHEIVPVEIKIPKKPSIIFDKDEFIKPETTEEILGNLRPAFKKEGGSVTAGNSSGLNDGAAALLIANQDALDKYQLPPLVKIVSSAVVGVEPRIMGIGPVEASKRALSKAKLTINDMDILELNEAFAVQVLSCLKELNVSPDDARVNPNGGAIAIGHPLGMSGSRIILSAALELNLTNKKYALVTMCVGVGQGYAVILENCNI